MADTSEGGWVRRAVTGAAVTRFHAFARATISAEVGCKAARMRSRASSTLIIDPSIHSGQFQQVVIRHVAAAVFHLVDHIDQPARDAAVDAVAGADLGNRCDLHIHFGAALAYGKV